MPDPQTKSKTIEIDEILPADGRGESSSGTPKSANKNQDFTSPEQPFPDLGAALGWKARLTLLLTQWFLILRSKSWGKWIIGPLVVLVILLAIPLAMLAVFGLIIASILRPLFQPRRNH